MGTKRPHSDLSTMHASRQANLQVQPSSQHTPNKRARNTPHHLPPKPSAHLLRKKIRDTARVLDHASNMPADARIESERALAGYRQDLEAVEEGRRRAKIIRKYHMVRFFERQKATRHLKKLRRRLADDDDDDDAAMKGGQERTEIEARIHVAEVDLNYAIYCPLDEKYTSLYPPKRDGEDDEAVAARHMAEKSWLPLWKVVEKCMVDGTLEALRNGTGRFAGLGEGGDGGGARMGLEVGVRRSGGIPVRAKKSRREERIKVPERRDDGAGSDGGFFEE